MHRRSATAARRAVVCLALGAITSVLVAWSFRAFYQKAPWPRQPYSLSDGSRTWHATVARAPGRFAINYQEQPPPGRGWQMLGTKGDPDPIPFTDEPAWAVAARRANSHLDGIGGYGWPCLAMLSLTTTPGRGPPQYVGLFTTPTWLGPLGGIRLPLIPMWPGLLADAAIFAAAWWAFLTGLTTLRRALRLHRGLCPICAYDLTGNTTGICPECGMRIAT